MVEAVVFDLDGVLVDSEPVWEQVRRALVAEFGGTWQPDTQDRLMGMSTGEWSRYLSQDLGVDLPPDQVARVVIDRMTQRYREHLPWMENAIAAVRRMAAHWPLGLASSAPQALIETVLDAGDLRDCFRVAISTEEVTLGKPAPDIYLTVTTRLGVVPAGTVAIEDSSNGLRAAAAAGCRVIAVPQPSYPAAPGALALASATLSSLRDLTPDVIRGLDPA